MKGDTEPQPDEALRAVAASFRETTEQHAADEARLWLAAIVESSDDAIIGKNLDGIILSWNAAAQRIYGYAAEEVIGQPFALLIPSDRPDELTGIMEQLRRGERIDHYETVRVRKDGRRVDVSVTISPIRDSSGTIRGASSIARDITTLKRAADHQREADRRKDEFLAVLAHELRNPLAPLFNGLHILRVSGNHRPTIEQARTMMERQLRQLARLVEDLLDVSRVTRGKIALRRERLDLGRLVRTTTEDRRAIVEQAGLTLTLEVPETPLWVMGDSTRLAQILVNLLDNAVRFTNRGGRVSVGLRADPAQQRVALHVRDTGIGIDPQLLPHLFEPFHQADRSLERSKGGLGLGLALVKGLTELHGGEVQAQSEGTGKGAEFVVRLPLEAEPAALSSMPTGCQPTGERQRILVVEDNRDAADSLRMLLELLGHEVRVAYAGPEGVQAARAWHPDIVLCDVGLPGLDGYGVAGELRRNPATAQARLVAVTGYGSDEDRDRARQAGFDHHLTKPADPAALVQLLGQPG